MKATTKQTAVEWLFEQIKSDQYQKALSLSEWMKVIEQAKAIEKEQIIEAYCNGDDNISAQQYYNETFKSE
jgi:hypothetical protein